MKKMLLFCILSFVLLQIHALPRHTVIEDFENNPTFESIIDYDTEPDSMQISPNGYSGNCLYLFGDTGKQDSIPAYTITQNTVLRVSVNCSGYNGLVAFGLKDSVHSLRYSLYGSSEQNIEEFVTVYQGAKEDDQWMHFLLPVADDWFAWYDYLPDITGLEFILNGNGTVYFDEIWDVTEDINQPPDCSFTYRNLSEKRNSDGTRDVSFQFEATAIDPEGDVTLQYNWIFGDGATLATTFDRVNHTYTVSDDHPYSVLLEVEDSIGAIGRHVEHIVIEDGESSLPIKLNFVGDVMLARRMTNMTIEDVFSDVDSVFGQAADISVANLETPLADTGTPHPTKSVVFRSSPSTVDALTNGGVDLVSLANNHTLDYMEPAFQQTQNILDNNGILHCGAGMNSVEAYKPVYIYEKGLILAFLGNSDRTGQYNNAIPYLNAGYDKAGFAYMTPYYITEQLNSVADIADLKIVMMHAGSEYSTSPGSGYDKFVDVDEDEDFNPKMDIPHVWDREIRHHAIDSGADLVIVHHPHKVHGVEVYNGKVIAHSLGNFVFDLNYPECFPSMILNTNAGYNGFKDFTITPVYLKNYKPRVVTGELGIHLLRDISMKSRNLGTIVNVLPELNRAEVILDSLVYNYEENLVQATSPLMEYSDTEFRTKPIGIDGIPSAIEQITLCTEPEIRLGRELFPFGNMEDEGVSYWESSDGLEYDSLNVFSGSRSILLNASNSEALFDRTLPFTSDELSFNAMIRTADCDSAYVVLEFYNSYNSWYSSSELASQAVYGTSDWTEVSLDLLRPDNADYFKFSLVLVGQSETSTANIDDVHLVAWDNWQSDMPIDIPYPNDYYWLQLRDTVESDLIRVRYTSTALTPQVPVENDSDVTNIVSNVRNYPNPFNPSTKIQFSLKERCNDLKVSVYNIKGQRIRTLYRGLADQGLHTVEWDGKDKNHKDSATGIYFYRVKANGDNRIGKMLMLK